MAESVIDYAVRVADARRNSSQRILQVIAEVNMPHTARAALLDRLKAAGVV